MRTNAEAVGRNLTLVAFYDSKLDSLVQLVDVLQTSLRSGLGSAFSAYPVEQVHATIVGLEGRRIGEEAFNAKMVQVTGRPSVMDLRGLFRFMQEMTPFHIRIGGFAAQKNYPFSSRGLHPYSPFFCHQWSIGSPDGLAGRRRILSINP